jgi:hypothetical protein
VERDRRLGQVVELEVARDQPAQPVIGHEVIAPPAHATNQRTQADREDVLTLQLAPDAGERSGSRDGLRPGGDKRRVERPN